MSDIPTPYVPQFSFYDFSSLNPNIPAPGQKWDIEYENIQLAISTTQSRLAEIQRDDGKLRNGIVDRYALAPGLVSGVNAPVPWAAGTDYSVEDSVMFDGSWYWALVPHNSGGSFDPSKWQYIGTFFSADPLTLALGTDSLVDGILSADTNGRNKMADGYVTLAKMAPEAKSSFVRAWANFSPIALDTAFSFTNIGPMITGVGTLGSIETHAGSTISFAGETGDNEVLNGSHKILTFDGDRTITFELEDSPPAPLVPAACKIYEVFSSFNVRTITPVSPGITAITFDTNMFDVNYVVSGMGATLFNPPGVYPQSPILSMALDPLPQMGGFTLISAAYMGAAVGVQPVNPNRVMFNVFGR